MIFTLTDEDTAGLEFLRQRLGHRSQAETLRQLIRDAMDRPVTSTELKPPVRPDERPLLGLAAQRPSAQELAAATSRVFADGAPIPSLGFGPVRAKPGSLLKGTKK